MIVKVVVRNIPRGKTLSYKEVASRAGNPRASRAVARIMSQNIDPSVPCHRVIHADGSIGGYNIHIRSPHTLSKELSDTLKDILHDSNTTFTGTQIKNEILQRERNY